MVDQHIYEPPPDDGINILHQDTDILVVSKPSGLLSVNGRNPSPENKLGDSLHTRVAREFEDARIVHRLDMDTSGIMVLAKHADSHRILSMQFEKRAVTKSYIAIVWGLPETDSGRVDLPMRCDWERRPRQIIDHEQGKSAQTDWDVLERGTAYGENTTRLVLKPETGRTHQLRVHMQAIDYPILGDDFYAHKEAFNAADRLLLHAEHLGFKHPSSEEFLEFTDACPF